MKFSIQWCVAHTIFCKVEWFISVSPKTIFAMLWRKNYIKRVCENISAKKGTWNGIQDLNGRVVESFMKNKEKSHDKATKEEKEEKKNYENHESHDNATTKKSIYFHWQTVIFLIPLVCRRSQHRRKLERKIYIFQMKLRILLKINLRFSLM